MGKTAADFEKIINEGRERKKNEALAAQIFGKGKDSRRRSVPLKSTGGGSLASRVGVQKRTASVARIPAGDINGEWTHDLHNARSTPNLRAAAAQSQPKPNSLAARLHAPGTAPPAGPRRNNGSRAAQVAGAFSRATASPAAAAQMNIRSAAPAAGMSIRGLAGPSVVMAQNFAPGTTAADIESAMTPIGGMVESCRLVKTHPLVIAEVVFQSREAAERVIQTFDNQTADGRLLHVYLKPGGASAPAAPAAPTGPRAQRTNELRHGSNVVVDGSMGFDDSMDVSDAGYSDGSGGGRGLYSDRMVSGGPRSGGPRRGRGFDRGRNGR